MFQGLQTDQLEGALEALLFVTDEPVGALRLAEMIEVELAEVEQALDALQQTLSEENRGIQLREVAGGWRLYTHPVYHELIEQYVISWDTRKISPAALETLAIVAYTQPTTRSSVSSIRGVNSDSSINSLVEKGLIREAGASDAPGNPILYATSKSFLEKFGLRSVADLPPLEDFVPDEETCNLIRERLSARRIDDGEILQSDSDENSEETSPLDAISFELEEDDEIEVSLEHNANMSPDSLLVQAMAQTAGAVEKIDFDSLVFESDDDE